MAFWANLSANRKILGRLAALEEDAESFRKTARDLRSLDLEFSNLYGKVKTALGRIEKRAAIIENEQEPAEEAAVGSGPPSPEGLALSPNELKWQNRILAERRRLTG